MEKKEAQGEILFEFLEVNVSFLMIGKILESLMPRVTKEFS